MHGSHLTAEVDRASRPNQRASALMEAAVRLTREFSYRSLHERADPRLVGSGQILQRESRRPHLAFVERRLVAEAERCVPRLELLCGLEEADHFAILSVRRHPVPEPWREARYAAPDDGMEPLAHGAIRWRHRGDLCEDGALFAGFAGFAHTRSRGGL